MPPDGPCRSPLPASWAEPLGVYVHIPFCRTRCGYCDFNTYTHSELGGGASQQEYPATLGREIDLARRVLDMSTAPVETIFFGGGTPTLLPPREIGAIIAGIDAAFGLAPGAEVTIEANPETVDQRSLAELRENGVTRVSFGMQSDVEHVLAVLDRQHQPGRPQQCARWARQAGFEHVSLDLIYGTPGESDADWEITLDAALAAEPDHVAAYALTVEPGTGLSALIGRGALPRPDDAVQARRFVRADERLQAAGLDWYELSSWAANSEARCRHNIGYWRSYDWWGVGPGAHSHVDGERWWNVLRPTEYAKRLRTGQSPAAGREVLTEQERALEAVLLGLRERAGLPLVSLGPDGIRAVEREVARRRVHIADGRVQLTRRGRLFADAVVRELSA